MNYTKGFVKKIVILIILIVLLALAYKFNDYMNPKSVYQNTDHMIVENHLLDKVSEDAVWKIHTSTALGFSIQYPADWLVDSGTGGLDKSVDIYNPLRRGKPDTDQPSEHIYIDLISKTGSPCVAAGWGEGLGGAQYATRCLPSKDGTFIVLMSAFDERGRQLEDKIVASMILK